MKQQRGSTIDEHVIINTTSVYARVSECIYFMKHILWTLSHAFPRPIAGGEVLASPRFSGLAASGLSDRNSKLLNDFHTRTTSVVTFISLSKMSFPGMPQPGAGAGGAGMTAQQQQEQAMIKGVRHHQRLNLH